jgi:hypothetical protein
VKSARATKATWTAESRTLSTEVIRRSLLNRRHTNDA